MGASAALGGGIGESGGIGGAIAESHAGGVSKSVLKISESYPQTVHKKVCFFIIYISLLAEC